MNDLHAEASGPFANRRIALFEPHPDLASNPTLVCLLEALVIGGARVDVLMPDPGAFPKLEDGVRPYPFSNRRPGWQGSIRPTLRAWRDWCRRARVDQSFRAGAYDLVLGVNSLGIVQAREYARQYDVPLVYLSFEILFLDELSRAEHIAEKEEERAASQHADLVVIQDRWRGALLAAENGIPQEGFEYLPVSPRDSASVSESDYLRRRFGLRKEDVIVLHSGCFNERTCASELLQSAEVWPEGFVLIVHMRQRLPETNKYLRAIREAKLPNVVLSADPLPASAYERLVASADIGLVLNQRVPGNRFAGKNIETIGLSSGRFSSYLKAGLPVITTQQPCYSRLLQEYGFGEVLASLGSLPEALVRVRSRLACHKAEARRLFTEKLAFDIHWPRLSKRLLEIMR